MRYSYFPGCTLHQQARSFDATIRLSAARLGIDLVELENWQCCGAVFPLAADAVINLVSPYRTLSSAHEAGNDLVTVCSGCLNVLRRTNRLVSRDRETKEKLSAFVEKEYSGQRQVYHLLEVIRKDITSEGLRQKVTKPLEGLRVAPYYGCLLLRPPEEMEFDDPEDPRIMEEFLVSLGADAVDYPFKTECCGAYLSISPDDGTNDAVKAILGSAQAAGSDVIATSCPMCLYNLDVKQEALARSNAGFKPIPVVYFSELLALALGVADGALDFEGHKVDPRPVLKEKMLMAEVK